LFRFRDGTALNKAKLLPHGAYILMSRQIKAADKQDIFR
jgi:hypothetical protein